MLRTAATVCALAHLAAAIAGGLVIGPGSALEPRLDTRAAYVSSHAGSWLAAWLVPMAAAVTVVWLNASIRGGLDPDGRDTRLSLAVSLATLGASIEITASCLAAAMLPALARGDDVAAFGGLARAVELATSTAGGTGFTLAQLLVVGALRRAGAPRAVVGLGLANVAAGVVFVVAGAAGWSAIAAGATALVLVSLSGFCLLLARSPLAQP